MPISVPVPVRLTVCGEPVALSVMLTDALREPKVVGVNVTVIVHVPLIATVAQVFVSEKELGFVPPMETPLTIKGADPVFVTVIA